MDPVEPSRSLADRPLLIALITGLPVLAAMATIAVILSTPNGNTSNGNTPSGNIPNGNTSNGDVPNRDISAVEPVNGEPIVYEPVVVGTYPHDPEAYTQGLEFLDTKLVESTGLVGQSSLRLVEPKTGQIIRSVSVDEPLFAEGATVVDDEIWQLTWRAGLLLIYSGDDLQLTGNIVYDGEGWGLCATDDHLFMSNGSDQLIKRDRQTFAILDSVSVTNDGQPVDQINELECVGDTVWANVWQTPELLSIDPATGRVTGTVDLRPLLPPEYNENDNVANGIAFDPETGHLWLTGKRWATMFEVELLPQS